MLLPGPGESVHVVLKGADQGRRHQRSPVFGPLAVPHGNYLLIEIQVFDTQPAGFGNPQPCTVEQRSDQLIWFAEFVDDAHGLFMSQNHW